MSNFFISKSGYDKLYTNLMNIDKEINKATIEMGKSVKRDNDLRENPEFMELRRKAMYDLPRRKAILRQKYENATIIEEMDEYINFDKNTVIIGSKVSINFDGEDCTYKILGTDEGDINNNILSCEAPISRAISGKKVGESVIFNGVKISIIGVERI